MCKIGSRNLCRGCTAPQQALSAQVFTCHMHPSHIEYINHYAEISNCMNGFATNLMCILELCGCYFLIMLSLHKFLHTAMYHLPYYRVHAEISNCLNDFSIRCYCTPLHSQLKPHVYVVIGVTVLPSTCI